VGKSASLTILRPAGALPGDLMFAGLTVRLSASERITAPSGWLQILRDSNIGGTSLTQALYYKIVDSSDFGPLTWRFLLVDRRSRRDHGTTAGASSP
jgi:hypothetical protein